MSETDFCGSTRRALMFSVRLVGREFVEPSGRFVEHSAYLDDVIVS